MHVARIQRIRTALFTAATAALIAAPLAATGSYNARLVNDDPVQGRKIENLQIQVERLSTPDELAALAGGDAKSAPEVGSARLDRTTARNAIAAVETGSGADKKLIVVFEKPLNWFDGRRNPSARKYPYGVLELPADGKGEGKLLAGAQVKFDKGSVSIESFSGDPMKVIQITNGAS